MKTLKIAAFFASIALLSIGAFAQIPLPEGRLSLSSTQAVMTADVVNSTTIYYLPDPGPDVILKYNNGGVISWGSYVVAPITLNLNSTQQTTGKIYDIFAYKPSANSVAIGIGPAWTSSTSRGSGSGSTAIQQDSSFFLW